ncbi:MAG: EthD family reductase [Anaerolineae bacterium]|mgnify:FL=1|jgi:uncharacterized protein (TIGR02118 family)|nr:EthD family reductase [Anaerolineae bacterium]MBT3714928.1 EthD family reductase [Anaerolineae bacterium]MBT4311619.1 EthD family reductase [Anaerolineae bacterium]MBT4459292.1 EthD family reductase [Anaerolineae bacterium]MBT4842131.1 EthD family reductase [Anaerolineae bacterium]
MHKLTIFFYPPPPSQEFDQQGWQKFMGLAEKMPGLRRETVSDVDDLLFGSQGHRYAKIHEFYFDSRAALDTALQSETGQAAGAFLHEFTRKRFTMVIAEHKEALPEEFVRGDKE